MGILSFLRRKSKEQQSNVQAPVSPNEQNAQVAVPPEIPAENQPDSVPSYVTQDGIELCDEQIKVADLLENSHDNFFITGKAGTGKSVLLRYFKENTKKKAAFLAPTGVAAVNIDGQTIHSFFRISPDIQDVNNEDQVRVSPRAMRELRAAEVIVIDEISMVRADLMDMIDRKLRVARNATNEPFGGCQLIVFGDLFQLPPVNDKDKTGQDFIYRRYETSFFFGAPVVQDNPFRIIELQTIHRQNDSEFISLLNKLRIGQRSSGILETLNHRCIPIPEGEKYIILTSGNSKAERINQQKLAELDTPLFRYDAVITGEFPSKSFPTNEHLELKVGAQVMMLRNDNQKHWQNGTLATICELSESCITVLIEGVTYKVEKASWNNKKYGYDSQTDRLSSTTIGCFVQFPVKLAYAITVHKSQGNTFNSVCLDYSDWSAFACGQTYVALSRCRSLEGIYLTVPLQTSDIKASAEVIEYCNAFINPQLLATVPQASEEKL